MPVTPDDVQTYGWAVILFIAFLWVLPKAATTVVKLYQDHKDWQRKNQQEKEKWERESEGTQEAWQRDLIREMFNQSTLNHQGVISVLNKQTEVLSALQSAIVELKTIMTTPLPQRRRTDFSKGSVTHQQEKIVAQSETITKVEG